MAVILKRCINNIIIRVRHHTQTQTYMYTYMHTHKRKKLTTERNPEKNKVLLNFAFNTFQLVFP